MIRVALVSPYFPVHRGGVEAVAGELAQRLSAGGHADITWHASDCDPPPPEQPRLRCVPARTWNFLERRGGFPYPLWSPGALRALARTVRHADVVHLHDCVYLPNVIAALAAAIHGKPLVVTQHVGAVPYRNPALRALLGAANRSLGAFVLGRAARVAFVGRRVQDYFSGFVRFRQPPLYLPNGVDTAVFAPDERRPPAREPQLLFVGRFVEKKGLPLLRQIAAALPEARWMFAGWGPLDPDAWKLPNVTVLRGLAREQLVPHYRAADLLVLPSTGEGFPLVVQEAMACGTPALVSDETAAGCPEAGELMLSEPVGAGDAASRWIARIRSYLASPAALRERVAAFAREHWDWDRCAARYAALLRDCAMEKQTSSRLGKQSADRPDR
jgi:glycosyltransferase involved in cell wall biosynthesis